MADLVDTLTDVAKGAAMGAPFGGPIGAAIGGFGGLIAHFAPSLLSDLFGASPDKAVQMATAAVTVVKSITGTDDPAAADQAVAGDPAAQLQLRVQLAQISADLRRSELEAQHQETLGAIEQMRVQLADVADARRTMSTLSGAGSRLSWGPVAVSVIVLAGFFLMAAMVLIKALDPNSILMGGMLAMATSVVSFWIGSTNSSVAMANKAADAMPADIARGLLPQVGRAAEAIAGPLGLGGKR